MAPDNFNYKKILLQSLLIVIYLGILPSMVDSTWEWFSRSGSLLVIFGVYIIWKDYKTGIIENLDFLENDIRERSVSAESAEYFLEGDISNINDVVANNQDELIKTINDLKISNKKKYELTELIIVSVGTFIWGYGNLLNNI